MKLVIEIPDHIYDHAKSISEDSNDEYEAMRAIAKGTDLICCKDCAFYLLQECNNESIRG